MSDRSEVKEVNEEFVLRCKYQFDDTLEEPHVYQCFGVVVSGKTVIDAVDKLETELRKFSYV